MNGGYKSKRSWTNVICYAILVILSIGTLYPVLWVVLSSFREGSSLYSPTPLPKASTLAHYRELFDSRSLLFTRWYWNTLKISVVSMILGTFLTTLVAYVFSRFRFYGRRASMSVLLSLSMFPGFMSMIAIYILLLQLKLLDTHLALILVYSAGAPIFGTFVSKGFLDTIPRSIDESARIDGASHFRVFVSINLPLARPMLTYLALTNFVGAWVDFIFARLILRSKEQWTVAVGLWDMVSSYQSSNFTLFSAGAVLVAIPITVLFLYLQRYMVGGLTAGASKG
ncbi:carbohydrate ABC transporter membrane protein 2, CUT1 family [Fontibacillus panacisegetis]|uniref:Carbohydrate ABC transporter membrane protein 2, CUT1 family n=1 Tax=Fontibacillus panacisegetis TaxID=670482 RepID=A0A1G7N801_9BACL|nr:sugar ABC transporter permease [Fontibacillus panacisegetis]SDF69460.1 carbohydrate ABC transporter membrane protein 2, CUT1 family [Fontibacillus panacisegetis]